MENILKNAAAYFLGTGMLALAGAMCFVTAAVDRRIDDVTALATKAPALIDDVRKIGKDVDAIAARADAAAEHLRASMPGLPEAGTKIGRAGANVLKGFAERVADAPGSGDK